MLVVFFGNSKDLSAALFMKLVQWWKCYVELRSNYVKIKVPELVQQLGKVHSEIRSWDFILCSYYSYHVE